MNPILAVVVGLGVPLAVAAWLLPWQWTLGLVLLLAAAAPLFARRFFDEMSRRRLASQSQVLAGTTVVVEHLKRLTRERVLRAFADPRDGVELLAEADEFDLRRHCLLEVTLTPPDGPKGPVTWDPGEIAVCEHGAQLDEAGVPSSMVAMVLGLEVQNARGGFEPWRGARVTGAATLRFVLAHTFDGPTVSLTYFLATFGRIDLNQVERPGGPASLHAKAQAFFVPETAHPTGGGGAPGTGVSADRPAPVARSGAEPARPSMYRAVVSAPTARARALASPPPDRQTAWRRPADVLLDVYAEHFDHFSTPPVQGLDHDALQPVRRQDDPARFSSAGPNDRFSDAEAADPTIVAQARAASVVYRVQVTLADQEHLGFLADALTTAASLAYEARGVVHDVHADRLLTHEQIRAILKAPAFEVADHVRIHAERFASGITLRTLGLAKFGRFELGFRGVPPDSEDVARHALLTMADYVAAGQVIEPNEGIQLGGELLVASPAEDGGALLYLDDRDGHGCGRWIRSVMHTAGAA